MPHNHFRKTVLLIKLCSVLSIVLFAACSSLREDGPPRGNIDVSHIPDAVPKAEPLSKSGNLPRYRVHGVTYHVRSSSHHYRERGIASWYGTRFHSQPTSSGEIYNMLGMTAAHKSLPLPTYVQVTNLRNRKSVIVKVNDRGPFAPGRIIDLSYAAAKKLDMTGHGTAYVEVSAIDPKSHGSTAQTAPLLAANTHSPEKFFVRVGSFENRQFAERLKTRVHRVIHSPVRITLPSGKKTFYRVDIGPLQNAVDITLVRYRLRMAGIDPGNIIRQRAEI